MAALTYDKSPTFDLTDGRPNGRRLFVSVFVCPVENYAAQSIRGGRSGFYQSFATKAGGAQLSSRGNACAPVRSGKIVSHMLSRESATGGRFIPNTAARRLLCLISQRPRQGDDDDDESTLRGERKSESATRHPATVKILGIFVKSTTTAQYGRD